MKASHLPVAAVLAVCSSVSGFSADSSSSAPHKLSEFKVGHPITGPAADLAQAKGKAVFVDIWGVNCPPCLKFLPEVEKLSHRYKDKLLVIGVHAQEASNEEVIAVVKKNRLSYSIVGELQTPIDFQLLPFGFVFDAAGKMIFAGTPGDRDFDRAIRQAVQSVTAVDAAAGSATAKKR